MSDLIIAAAVAAITGVGFLLLSESMPPDTVGGVAGRQLWWLIGLFWGGVTWVVRRFVFY